tara:strand:+ start:176 stop:994 length:819 start_codon:yes stop_codon:yes gene_type:complete
LSKHLDKLREESKFVFNIEIKKNNQNKFQLVKKKVTFPWSLGRGYEQRSGINCIRILPQVAGAGLMSGDNFFQRVYLGKDVRARMEDSGSMIVLSGKKGPAATHWEYIVNEGGILILDSEPYCLLDNAKCEVYNTFYLSESATVISLDGFCHSKNLVEKFGFYKNETNVRSLDGKLILMDRQKALADSLYRLSKYVEKGSGAVGTINIFAVEKVSANLIAVVDDLDIPNARTAFNGISGFSVRLLAPSGGQLRNVTKHVLGQFEQKLKELVV